MVFKLGFSALLLAFLVFAISGLKAQLYLLELDSYPKYWQSVKPELKQPSEALQARIANTIEASQQSLLPINPATWVGIGRIYYWYAVFADIAGKTDATQAYLIQAQQAYRVQSKVIPQWPYSYLLTLEIESKKLALSDDFSNLWQANIGFAQSNGQVNFALAKLIPNLWPKLTPDEQKQALLVFYQAAIHSPQQANALVQLKHDTLTLLTATCMLAKAKQTPLNFCQ